MTSFWIIAVIILLFSLIYPRSKVIAIIQLIMIWILMGWNSGGMDFRGNEAIYYQSSRSGFTGIRYDWLSNLIGYFFNNNSVDFVHYNIVTIFVILLIFGVVVLKESKKPCVVINLFIIYPFLDSVVQKRFFLGMVLIFLGILFLMNKKRIFYLGCVVLALGFHFSFIIFLPLFFFDLIDEKREKYIIGIAILTEMLIISDRGTFLQRFISNAKLNRYIFEQSYSSIIIGLIYTVAFLGYIFICDEITFGFQQNDKVIFFRKLNRLLIILAPMCLFESVYMRYYRIILLWAYIIISNENECPLIQKGVININKRNIWIWIFIIYLIVLNWGMYFTSSKGIAGFIDTMLHNDFLLNL